MSSLIFATSESQIFVATDTLTVTPDGEPFSFTSKAIYIPHLRTIVAGTGAGGFSNEWVLTVITRMVVDGIHSLDNHTPNGLRELWVSYAKDYSVPEGFTTTVYQFGISEINNKVVSFAYRSSNNFKSEQLPYGTGVKPKCSVTEGDFIEQILPTMLKQREIQEQLPKDQRIYIGGGIYAFYLTTNECRSFKLGKFPDFEEHEQKIFENHRNFKR